jgi:hypothetical protein
MLRRVAWRPNLFGDSMRIAISYTAKCAQFFWRLQCIFFVFKLKVHDKLYCCCNECWDLHSVFCCKFYHNVGDSQSTLVGNFLMMHISEGLNKKFLGRKKYKYHTLLKISITWLSNLSSRQSRPVFLHWLVHDPSSFTPRVSPSWEVCDLYR